MKSDLRSYLSAGFTMVEMTIVLIMIGILTAALAPMLLRQHTNTMEERDRTALENAKTTLIGYAITNGGMPNPLTEGGGVIACGAAQINPMPIGFFAATRGVGMMPPSVSLLPSGTTCTNAVPALMENNWGAFGDINNISANYLQTFQLDVSDALMSFTTLKTSGSTAAYSGGNKVAFCQAVQQQLTSGYCSNGTSTTASACSAAAATWIAGGYCFNKTTLSVTTSTYLNPTACNGAAGNVWLAAPQVCQDTTGDHFGTTLPNAACTSYSPAAFVLYSTGNNRKPDQSNDQGPSKLGTSNNAANRIYENDTRGVNNTPGNEHYDDQVMSYPLTAMARDCREKMNVLPEVMSCQPGQVYLGSITNNDTTHAVTYDFNAVLPAITVPGNGFTLYLSACRAGTDKLNVLVGGVVVVTLNGIAYTPATLPVLSVLDLNHDGRVDVFIDASDNITTQ